MSLTTLPKGRGFLMSARFRSGFLLIFALLLGIQALEAQNTWDGSQSSDWNDPLNWSAGVPDANDFVIIADVTNDPIISTAVVAGTVRVSSGGLLTVNTGASLTINFNFGDAAFQNEGSVVNDG